MESILFFGVVSCHNILVLIEVGYSWVCEREFSPPRPDAIESDF